ncbi:MAG: addiction module protein [Polyangiaceae bacterium]|nr:addiction module protein [Polyangiaceae bacterium]
MPPDLQRLTDEILSMPAASRALLARIILDSLGTSETEEIERSWAREAGERTRQIDAGEVELLDGDDVMRELRAMCQ